MGVHTAEETTDVANRGFKERDSLVLLARGGKVNARNKVEDGVDNVLVVHDNGSVEGVNWRETPLSSVWCWLMLCYVTRQSSFQYLSSSKVLLMGCRSS